MDERKENKKRSLSLFTHLEQLKLTSRVPVGHKETTLNAAAFTGAAVPPFETTPPSPGGVKVTAGLVLKGELAIKLSCNPNQSG